MLLFGRVVYIHLLNLVGSLCCSSALFPYFYMVVLSITESGVLKLPMITVQLSLVVSFGFIYFDDLSLGVNVYNCYIFLLYGTFY